MLEWCLAVPLKSFLIFEFCKNQLAWNFSEPLSISGSNQKELTKIIETVDKSDVKSVAKNDANKVVDAKEKENESESRDQVLI